MSSSPSRELELFTAALQLKVSERAAFLDRMREGCGPAPAGGGPAGRPRRSGRFPRTATGNEQPRVLRRPAGRETGRLDWRYRLLQQIGEGVGIVYLAEQEEPVRRLVALEIVKPGMDTRSVIVRFEAERQALAMMDHPNIANVFDAGATECPCANRKDGC